MPEEKANGHGAISSARTVIKSGLLLTAGSMGTGIVGFAKNILIARMLGVEQFGVAAAMSLVIAFAEMTSNFALDRLLVQAPEGDDRIFQKNIQTAQTLQGMFGALLLFASAIPVSHIFDIPEKAPAFQILAIIPLLRGLANLDKARLQRHSRFGAHVGTELGAQLLSLIAVFPAIWFFEDYRAMVVILLVQAFGYFAVSHLMAERRWAITLHMDYADRIITFGLPLLANGLIMFGIMQADRAIVGSMYSLDEMSHLAVATTMTLVPSMLLGNVLMSFFLPRLSRTIEHPADFQKESGRIFLVINALAVCFLLGSSLLGPFFLKLLYGDAYQRGAELIALLGIAQSIRIARAAPTLVLLSTAKTRDILYANCVRLLAVPVAFYIGLALLQLEFILYAAILFEIFSHLTAMWFVQRTKMLKLGHILAVIFLFLASVIVMTGVEITFGEISLFVQVQPLPFL